MKKNKWYFITLATAWCCVTSAQGYSNAYFFGDSDVDAGSYIGTLKSGVPVCGKLTSK